jgi:hypothetical protein
MEHHHHHILPVWFFVGALLLIYGIIILTIGIREFSHPVSVVLAGDHFSLWGGLLLIVLGGFYSVRFRPRRKRR